MHNLPTLQQNEITAESCSLQKNSLQHVCQHIETASATKYMEDPASQPTLGPYLASPDTQLATPPCWSDEGHLKSNMHRGKPNSPPSMPPAAVTLEMSELALCLCLATPTENSKIKYNELLRLY